MKKLQGPCWVNPLARLIYPEEILWYGELGLEETIAVLSDAGGKFVCAS